MGVKCNVNFAGQLTSPGLPKLLGEHDQPNAQREPGKRTVRYICRTKHRALYIHEGQNNKQKYACVMSSYTIKHKQRWLLADLVLCSTDGVEYPEERLE